MSTDAITSTTGSPELGLQKHSTSNTESDFSRIMSLHKRGYLPEEIADECENLTVAEVYAALDYLFANKGEAEH